MSVLIFPNLVLFMSSLFYFLLENAVHLFENKSGVYIFLGKIFFKYNFLFVMTILQDTS